MDLYHQSSPGDAAKMFHGNFAAYEFVDDLPEI